MLVILFTSITRLCLPYVIMHIELEFHTSNFQGRTAVYQLIWKISLLYPLMLSKWNLKLAPMMRVRPASLVLFFGHFDMFHKDLLYHN